MKNDEFEQMAKPGQAPEKIYGWLDTQLSVARHYGGMKFRGHSYFIDYADPQHPLVRQDIFQLEKKQALKKKQALAKALTIEHADMFS
jgi:hypothetical protein